MTTPDHASILAPTQSDCRSPVPSTSQGPVPTSSSSSSSSSAAACSSSSSLSSSSAFSSASSSSVEAVESKLLTLPVLPPSTLAILTHPTKGRCLHTTVPLPRGTLVDISPVLVFSKEEYNKVEDGLLGSYTFGWKSVGDDGKVVRKGEMALALGMGSLFNHSATPNVSYTLHPETLTIHYQTTRPVAAWEELCICYGDKLWFEDANAGAQDRIAGGRDGGRGREAKIRMKDEEEHEDDDTEESVLQALMAIELGETQEQEEQEEEEDEGMRQTHMKSNNT